MTFSSTPGECEVRPPLPRTREAYPSAAIHFNLVEYELLRCSPDTEQLDILCSCARQLETPRKIGGEQLSALADDFEMLVVERDPELQRLVRVAPGPVGLRVHDDLAERVRCAQVDGDPRLFLGVRAHGVRILSADPVYYAAEPRKAAVRVRHVSADRAARHHFSAREVRRFERDPAATKDEQQEPDAARPTRHPKISWRTQVHQ